MAPLPAGPRSAPPRRATQDGSPVRPLTAAPVTGSALGPATRHGGPQVKSSSLVWPRFSENGGGGRGAPGAGSGAPCRRTRDRAVPPSAPRPLAPKIRLKAQGASWEPAGGTANRRLRRGDKALPPVRPGRQPPSLAARLEPRRGHLSPPPSGPRGLAPPPAAPPGAGAAGPHAMGAPGARWLRCSPPAVTSPDTSAFPGGAGPLSCLRAAAPHAPRPRPRPDAGPDTPAVPLPGAATGGRGGTGCSGEAAGRGGGSPGKATHCPHPGACVSTPSSSPQESSTAQVHRRMQPTRGKGDLAGPGPPTGGEGPPGRGQALQQGGPCPGLRASASCVFFNFCTA